MYWFFVITFYLSKEEVGKYDIILTTLSLFIPIINLQLTDGILRWLLDNNEDLNKGKVLTQFIINIFCKFSHFHNCIFNSNTIYK